MKCNFNDLVTRLTKLNKDMVIEQKFTNFGVNTILKERLELMAFKFNLDDIIKNYLDDYDNIIVDIHKTVSQIWIGNKDELTTLDESDSKQKELQDKIIEIIDSNNIQSKLENDKSIQYIANSFSSEILQNYKKLGKPVDLSKLLKDK